MKIVWTEHAWADYLFWQENDQSLLKRVNALIKAIQRTPFEGLGKPEKLRHDKSGYWSRRIDQEHRLVYKVEGQMLSIAQCRFHYKPG